MFARYKLGGARPFSGLGGLRRSFAAKYVMAIDQGTTSSRVLLINQDLKIVDSASREHE